MSEIFHHEQEGENPRDQDPTQAAMAEVARLQELGEFDAAIEHYVALEQAELADDERGQLNVALAQCYLALIQQAQDADPVLVELLSGSVQTALVSLDGEAATQAEEQLRAALDFLDAQA